MRLIHAPSVIPAAQGKRIEEFIGRVNTGTDQVSIALMRAPAGWSEPYQTPEFDEWTLVLKGRIIVEDETGRRVIVEAGQAVEVRRGETVRYSCPPESGAVYVSVCVPAFSPETAHRRDK